MPTYITTVPRTYNNRRLKAGDPLTGVSRRDGEIMVKIGRAERVPDAFTPPTTPPKSSTQPPVPPAPPVAPPTGVNADPVTVDPDRDGTMNLDGSTVDSPADTLSAVRAEYERVVGKRAFHGWDEAELRRRMAEHQSGATDGDDGSS